MAPPVKNPARKSAARPAGKSQPAIFAPSPLGGTDEMSSRLVSSCPVDNSDRVRAVPGRCPAPKMATTFFPGAVKIFVARYLSRSSMRTLFTLGI